MLGLTECMDAELAGAFERAGYDPSLGKAVVSNRPDLCEYQCNGAMAGAKTYKKAPFMIAEDVKKELAGTKVFSSSTNFFLSSFPFFNSFCKLLTSF